MYLTVTNTAGAVVTDPTWRFDPKNLNSGVLSGPTADPDATLGQLSDEPTELVAWDPIRGEAAWRVKQEGGLDGGVLSMAGGLVLVGRAPSRLAAYRARDGKLLWDLDVGARVEAPPVTYSVDGVQYVAVAVGQGVPSSQFTGTPPAIYRGRARVLAFALGRRGVRVPTEWAPRHPPPEIARDEFADVSAEDLRYGNRLYDKYCVMCHGPAAVSGGPEPDLRHSTQTVRSRFAQIVRDGALLDRGMPGFAGQLSDEDLRSIQAYIVARARLDVRR
jgi:cytochrome c553